MPFLFFIFCPKAARFLPGMGEGESVFVRKQQVG